MERPLIEIKPMEILPLTLFCVSLRFTCATTLMDDLALDTAPNDFEVSLSLSTSLTECLTRL